MPHAMDHDVDCVVVGSGFATWDRLVNENVQEQFVHNQMSEPYLLRNI